LRNINLRDLDEELIQDIKLGHLSEILDIVKIKFVDSELQNYSNKLSDPLDTKLANSILKYFSRPENTGRDFESVDKRI